MPRQPEITKTTHELPFQKLSPLDFERMCLWLVQREGYEHAEHLGAAGSEQGRDVLARRADRKVVFQCKRVERLDPGKAAKEIDKLLELDEAERPDDIVFVVSTTVSVKTRDRAREAWGDRGSCDFWSGSELDEMVKRYPDVVEQFFGQDAVEPELEFSTLRTEDPPPWSIAGHVAFELMNSGGGKAVMTGLYLIVVNHGPTKLPKLVEPAAPVPQYSYKVTLSPNVIEYDVRKKEFGTAPPHAFEPLEVEAVDVELRSTEPEWYEFQFIASWYDAETPEVVHRLPSQIGRIEFRPDVREVL